MIMLSTHRYITWPHNLTSIVLYDDLHRTHGLLYMRGVSDAVILVVDYKRLVVADRSEFVLSK